VLIPNDAVIVVASVVATLVHAGECGAVLGGLHDAAKPLDARRTSGGSRVTRPAPVSFSTSVTTTRSTPPRLK
jgi:hypothetical protein